MMIKNKCLYLQAVSTMYHHLENKSVTKMLRYTLLLMVALTTLQAVGQNYVKTENYLDETGSRFTTDIQYFDGIGRKSVSASNGVNPNGKYVYTMQTYDVNGLEAERWLPAVGSLTVASPSYSDFESLSSGTYNGNYYGFSENRYDALDRVVTIRGAGDEWHYEGRYVHKCYDVNTQDDVKRYKATQNGDSLICTGSYPVGSLTMEETTDEDGKRTQVYKDFLERTVMERSITADSLYDTYYVYNDRSQLCFVLTPEYQKSGYKDLFGYNYRYDEHGQIIKKIRPQCREERLFYDLGGRVIYTEDAVGQYKFFFYDNLGRQVIKGSCSNFNYHNYKDVVMQIQEDGLFGTGYLYAHPSSLTGASLDEATFYDNYQFLTRSIAMSSPSISLLTKANAANAAGLLTGRAVRTSSNQMLLTVYYYDSKGRIVDQRETLLNGGFKKTVTNYSHTNKPLTQTVTLTKGGVTTSVVKTYSYYNSNDQLQNISIAYNNASPVRVAEYEYNDLGQLLKVTRGGVAGETSYTYNLRGWTTSITSNKFSEWLHYTDGLGTPCYSGNISTQQWKADNEGFRRGYKFYYDGMGRMTKAQYAEGDAMNTHVDRYTEWVKEYTSSNSIRKIERYGKKNANTFGKIDNLRLYYNGLRLYKVKEDAAPLTYAGAFDFVSNTVGEPASGQYEFYYDGSLKWDANKNIALIEYGRYNMPTRVQFTNGNRTEYEYSATGQRLRTIHRTAVPNISVPMGSTITLNASNTLSVDSLNYCGDFIFENGQLSKYLFDGGYATFTNGQSTWHYYYQDHLGNIRAVVNHDGTVEQRNHYYPFGAVYGDIAYNDGLQKYKYNGKELDRMHGLNFYDYDARQYDPLLCMFTQTDPLAEKYYGVNPYAYCANNPINAIDTDGRYITYFNRADGKTYVYYNGYFYHSTFTSINGIITPKGKSVYVPPKSYMGRTLLALRKMENSSNDIVRKVFNDVANLNSGKEHNISAGTIGSPSSISPECGGHSFIKINYNDKSSMKYGVTYTDYEILGHELKHAYDIQNYQNSRKVDEHTIKLDEYNTVNFENLIRMEEGRPLRTNYHGYPIPKDQKNRITLWN